MTEDFNPESASFPELDAEIARRTGTLIELNAGLINDSRKQAKAALDMAERYHDLADECDEIARLYAIGARRVADLNGDIISAEWGLEVVEDTEEEDEEGNDV